MVPMLQKDAMVGIGVAARTTAGNPKDILQDGEPAHERRPTTRNRSTLARPKAAGNGRKHSTRTVALTARSGGNKASHITHQT